MVNCSGRNQNSMKNIVVTTDFSIKSYNALDLGKIIATKTKGVIHLIHVVEPVLGQYSSVGEVMDSNQNDRFMVELIEKTKAEFAVIADKHKSTEYDLHTHILVGYPHKEIIKFVEEKKADLLLMGSKGYRDAEDIFLGSITEKVVQSNATPVITVNEVSPTNSFKDIVYATDLEEENKSLMNLLMRLQDLFDATLHIVKINTRRNFKNDIETNVELKQLVNHYQLKNYTLNIYNHEDEELGIVYFADEKNADLIAMGIHERSGFTRILSGKNMADTVRNHTYRPILTSCFKN